MTQQTATDYLRHGQTPFYRLPVADFSKPVTERYGDVDAVLLGVPYDGGTTYQPGTRLGPYHVRRVSALVESFHPVHRMDVFGQVRCVDGGNVPAPPFDAAAVRELVHGDVAQVVAAGAVPFVVGGDHSIALPVLHAVAERHGPLAVVHVDAHLDTCGPEGWGESYHHGTPIRHALEFGLIERGQLYQIGIRDTWGSAQDGDFGASHGASVFFSDDVADRGVRAIMAEIRERIGARPLYVTFDIDGVDPAFAPGTGTPVPGGLSSREALMLIRALAGANLVGMDLVEILPALDHADITSHLAAHLLFEGLALLAVRTA